MDLVNLPLSRWAIFVGSRLRKPGQVITRSWTQTARKYHALQRARKPQHYSFSLGETLQAQIEIYYELNQLDYLISVAARAQNASLSAIMVLHSDFISDKIFRYFKNNTININSHALPNWLGRWVYLKAVKRLAEIEALDIYCSSKVHFFQGSQCHLVFESDCLCPQQSKTNKNTARLRWPKKVKKTRTSSKLQAEPHFIRSVTILTK